MANVKYLIGLLTICACGSPFTEVIPDPHEGGDHLEGHHDEAGHEAGRDAVTDHDARSDVQSESSSEADAPQRDVISPPDAGDAGHEASPPVDAGHEAAPPDAGHDSGPCLPPSSYDYKIFSGGSTFVGYTAPIECQCAATYTCACLLAAPGICTASFGIPTGCTAGTILTVDCSP